MLWPEPTPEQRAASAELQRKIDEAQKRFEAMSPDDQKKMRDAQRESWVRAEMSWPKPKFKMIDGVKVYDSYEDYLND
jgi:hypothetical protein